MHIFVKRKGGSRITFVINQFLTNKNYLSQND